jgi:hypothetical protein
MEYLTSEYPLDCPFWRRAAATALTNFFELRWLRISGACPEAELTFGAHPRIR